MAPEESHLPAAHPWVHGVGTLPITQADAPVLQWVTSPLQTHTPDPRPCRRLGDPQGSPSTGALSPPCLQRRILHWQPLGPNPGGYWGGRVPARASWTRRPCLCLKSTPCSSTLPAATTTCGAVPWGRCAAGTQHTGGCAPWQGCAKHGATQPTRSSCPQCCSRAVLGSRRPCTSPPTRASRWTKTASSRRSRRCSSAGRRSASTSLPWMPRARGTRPG